MVRRIPIRAKVAGALAVPLLGLVVAAGLGASANTALARDVSHQAELATASIGHAGLIDALQNERNLALLDMLGLSGGIDLPVDEAVTARELTDTASTVLRGSISGQDDARRVDYGAAMRTLTELPAVRAQVDAAVAAPDPDDRDEAQEAFATYTTMITALFSAHDRFSLAVDDAQLRQGDELLHHSSHAADSSARLVERLLYFGSGPGGLDEPTEAAQIAELRRDVETRNAAIGVNGTGDFAAPADDLLGNARATGLTELAREAVEDGGPVDPAALLATMPLGPDRGYPAFQDDVVELLDARAGTLRDQADARRRLYLGGGAAVLALALLIAWWVSRSITRPLHDLSLKARQIATYRLPTAVQDILDAPPGEDLVIPEPDPVVVSALDEVGDVASAFNMVQQSAVGLAVEQAALRRNVAESYVNLGRRNQNLLGRLLDAVGDLEQGESDPERLAQLYKLDHLATRIRRNAESLLVLSHAEPSAGWQPPVDIADIVRAALGEIENYERVLVRSLDPTPVLGGASADLAHLLAELIENGLRHSPPRELVEVNGLTANGGYRINIIDHGLGMTPDDIERANQRLAGTESYTVTPAKYLGHYVTAVLAARHGITVRLHGSVVVGIAARVELPAALITDGTDIARGPTPATGEGTVPVADHGVPAVAPSADELRTVVSLLRARTPRPTAVTPPAPASPRAAAASANAASTMPGWARPVAELPLPPGQPPDGTGEGAAPVAPDGAGSSTPTSGPAEATNGDVPRRHDPPERTASGLVRRVRGAHVPVGVAVARADASPGPAASAPPDGPSSAGVDGAEMQRFLTSLVGGVQRSLDEQSPASGAGDEV